MAFLFWIGLAVSILGTVLLTIFGVIWIKDDPLVTWGFRLGLVLMLIGVSLLSVAN